MPPRQSTTRSQSQSQSHAQPQPQASSSKRTLEAIPPPDCPESLTPDYQPGRSKKARLTVDEAASFVQDLIGISPMDPLLYIEEQARRQIYRTVEEIDASMRAEVERQKGSDAMYRELDIGTYQLETLLEMYVDKAYDRFTAWTLRNAFDVPPDADLVMPYQVDLDFDRAEYVVKLPKGEETLTETIEDLREQVEQARLLSFRLAEAEKQMDRRLAIARQRKAEVGFVKEVLAGSNLLPLPPRMQQIKTSLTALHDNLASLETLPPPETTLPPGTKAWEMGRQAYLTWAVGKMIHPEAKDDTVEVAEAEMEKGGGQEGLDRLSKAVGA